MTLDLLVGGMPRGGTTVAAKFMSLHQDAFCYAGETHLIPFMHGMFGQLPCRRDKVDLVSNYLHQQFMTAMVEMPRFSVSQGAHPDNLIFAEKDVDNLVDAIRGHLKKQLYGATLFRAALVTLRDVITNSKAAKRLILGEKTPNNIFAMAEYAGETKTKNVVVMREPIGVLRSMKARVDGGDAYSCAFKGDLETNVGMYLEYAAAARKALTAPCSLLVRYEDMAASPAKVIQNMFNMFGREVEDRVIQFVEKGGDPEIANRAPMNYRRLCVNGGLRELSPVDVWKIFSLTRGVRDEFGYSDTEMAGLGFDVPAEWPCVDIPSQVLLLSGFHLKGLFGAAWMKRRGRLIVYLGKGRSHDVFLRFKSKFPDIMKDEAVLRLLINDVNREELSVRSGKQVVTVKLNIRSDELIPMGNKGGYVVIDLESSIAHNELGHSSDGVDAREVSFQLVNWSIDKRAFKWWWR